MTVIKKFLWILGGVSVVGLTLTGFLTFMHEFSNYLISLRLNIYLSTCLYVMPILLLFAVAFTIAASMEENTNAKKDHQTES